MFKLIISALDGSAYSLKALDYAGRLAEKHQSKLVLLHAYHPISELRGEDDFNKMLGKRIKDGEAILRNAREQLKDRTIDMEDDLLEGPAANAIINAVEARKADLVVMGTRGMGSLRGMVFGSVSTKVTHHAPCSVLVVR